MSESLVVDVIGLGAEGDGICEIDGQRHFVSGVLPGERIAVTLDCETVSLERIEQTSAERAQPICRHFGRCGGCRTQHFSAALNERWKGGIVAGALAHQGLTTDIADVHGIGEAKRRRAVLAAKKVGGEILLGYRAAGSHTIVDLDECPVLDPVIVAALGGLRQIMVRVLAAREGLRISIVKAQNGLDVATGACERTLSANDKSEIAAMAQDIPLLRLRIGQELILQQDVAITLLSGVGVATDPGMFLQAVPEAEELLCSLVLEGVGRSRRVADLFCGAGTFTLPLARRAQVTSVDGERRSIEALDQAIKSAQGLKPITTMVRDLFRAPLSRTELAAIDAVVFDPPRAGAQAQCEAIARSDVAIVVGVSCNPATFARDARILVDGGYRLERVVPVDQFVYSPHVEVVGVFKRPGKKRRSGWRP